MIVYHFTCADHGVPGITRTRRLLPYRHPLLGVALVWLTDLPVPDRWGLGLTSSWISCDRTDARVDVEWSPEIEQWGRWAHEHRTPSVLRDVLEDGALPAHWWVSEQPLPVRAVLNGPTSLAKAGGS